MQKLLPGNKSCFLPMLEPVYNCRNIQLTSEFQHFEQSVKSTQTTQTAHHRLVTRNRLCRYSPAQHNTYIANGELSLTGTDINSPPHSVTPTPLHLLLKPPAICQQLSLAWVVLGCPLQAPAHTQCSEALTSDIPG